METKFAMFYITSYDFASRYLNEARKKSNLCKCYLLNMICNYCDIFELFFFSLFQAISVVFEKAIDCVYVLYFIYHQYI